MKLRIIAVGRLKSDMVALAEEYEKRIVGGVAVKEISTQDQKAECAALLKALPDKAFVVLLDERGKDLSSPELAETMAAWQETGKPELIFLIGGADGVTEEVRTRADFCLSFGRKVWPHKLIRVMLMEQIYRAQQINAGHPYHRE
jgi:23S rRNA (pseudouridine1915-N3)-methyltransferase